MDLSDFKLHHTPYQVSSAKETATPEPEVEEVDDDLAYTYELDEEELGELKETYDFLHVVMIGILNNKIKMPVGLVKRLEKIMGNLHFTINTMEEFRPEEAGEPCIAVTLEDNV